MTPKQPHAKANFDMYALPSYAHYMAGGAASIVAPPKAFSMGLVPEQGVLGNLADFMPASG